ncbi:MAG: RNA polymerase factor sigma-54 [Puniceicoccales bacterium]|nr:RNA polymerase factor sigma-54 [Puniceicoccales bacterium]
MDILLSQDQKQVQKLSPIMRQSLEILQMPTVDLCELIKKECKKNPTIEIADRQRNMETFSREKSDLHQEFLENIEEMTSLKDHLLQQVPEWEEGEKSILLKLLEFITERGFFDGDLRSIAKSLDVDIGRVEHVYDELKLLHPHGIGAKNLQECLLLQLDQNADGEHVELAKTLVREYFGELQKGKIDFLSAKLYVPRKNVIAAGKIIARLNFSPISGFSNERNVTIIPDLKICKLDGEWVINFNVEHIPLIRFSELYKKIASDDCGKTPATWQYLKKQAKYGKQLYEAISRRQATLMDIARVILNRQIDFFERGPKFMRTLRLIDAAEQIKLHISTISRAVRGKYIDTPHGVFEMSKFFDAGGMESISQSAILERIREIIKSAKTCITDAKIAEILKQNNVHIARRTVAKYRKMINLPNSRQTLIYAATNRNIS